MSSNNLHLSGGVGQKIFAAFFAVSLFSFASALVGWIGLGFVREAQDTVLRQAYPGVRDAQIIARESSNLVLHMSSLFDARSLPRLETHVKEIGAREQRITALLAHFDNSDLFGGLRGQLETRIADLSENVETLAKLSRQTILTGMAVDREVGELLTLSHRIIDGTHTIAPIAAERTIENAEALNLKMTDRNEWDGSNLQLEFESFLQQNMGDLQKITDLQFRSEVIRDQLIRLGSVNSTDHLRLLRDETVLNLRAVTNAIVRLEVAGVRETFAEPLTRLSGHMFKADNIFSRKEHILANRDAMDEIRARADIAGQAIADLAERITIRTESVMNEQSSHVRVIAGRTQVTMTILAILAFAASILIFVIYINNNILFRLQRLAASVSSLTGGDLSQAVPATGDDQITRLEEAVEAFRNNSIRLREAENKLVSRSEELERSNQDLQQFAYVTSHDLRAPLRAIGSLSEWIEEDLVAGNSKEASENLSRLRNRVRRMELLLTGILQYARAGSQDSDNEWIPFAVTVRQIFEDLNNDERFGIVIQSNVETVYTGSSFFHQVLGNMIANAIKHHDKPTGQVKVELVSDAHFNTLTISDDGPGIPENLRSKVFKMFQTLKPRDEVEASGIGLALVKRLVERRAGNLKLTQSDAGGACFTIKWPIEGETDG